MSQRSRYVRLAIVLAAGSLVALAGATPAVAGEGWDPGSGDSREWVDGWDSSGVSFAEGFDGSESFGEGFAFTDGGDGGVSTFTVKGRVNLNGGLILRSSPTRNSRLVRVARNGEIVHIFCKTRGESVNGDSLWYLLDDGGTWSWGPARFIDAVESPPWC
ncbi:hypothetical protein GCM10011579_060460 [Streptomyces albiflavescens]|uniref:SH3b domain-containing protein n=1 Tax=Streptomyces albiflavescens TaxID=1623582 RepID=A0A917Y9B2_9ACTN|nr:SH3 domain-containing protein [Streptomyces albiflavescens]GGN77845.1 hypothetical protein GCM10011579_060460 [Streptomyces albiflavescens]